VIDDDDEADRRPSPISPATEDDSEWYYARDRTQQGPVRLGQLQRMADTGEIGPATLVWTSGFEQWTPAGQVDDLHFPIRLDAIAAAHGAERTAATASVTLPPRQAGDTLESANPPHRTSILAINSLVMGCLWLFGLGSLAAIGLGAMAIRQIGRSQGMLTGKRLALAGILVGIAGLALTLGLLIGPGLFSGTAP
jgi:hypothetical protein